MICADPREKDMFEDVDVKFQAHLCLKFYVDVFEHAPFPADRHILLTKAATECCSL